MQEVITSRENTKIKYACKLAQNAAFRRSEGSFLAEGSKLVQELAKTLPIKVILYTAKALEKEPRLAALCQEQYLIEPHVAEKLADATATQGVFAVFETPRCSLESLHRGGHYLALERVQDPGNVGALIRSAAAFGFDAVILGPGCASPWAPKTLRSGMGAAGQIPVLEVPSLPDALTHLGQQGVTCLAAALYNSQPLSQVPARFDGGLCVVIGSEGQGLTQQAVDACALSVRIPITQRVESLNAGVAGSVLLWHFRGAVEE